jgi:hypothetical protein
MFNERPIDDPVLQQALDEMRAVLLKYDLAGAVCVVNENEAAFTYKIHAEWSALRPDPNTPLGFRLRARTREDGKELTERRVESALHTICQVADFGQQTQFWMNDMKVLARQHGIEFDHTPFGGKPLPHISGMTG